MLKNGSKKSKIYQWSSSSHDETLQYGKELASLLPKSCLVCLEGELGAGKTTLCKGLIHALTRTDIAQILSPTYTYVRTYQNKGCDLHHFDCYRINSDDEFIELGLEDLLNDDGIKLIEWPDHILNLLPQETYKVQIHYDGQDKRKITLQGMF